MRLAGWAVLALSLGRAFAQGQGSDSNGGGDNGGGGDGNADPSSQASPSPSPSLSAGPTASANASTSSNTTSATAGAAPSLPANAVVTTITSLVPGPSGSPSQTATFVLTLTLGPDSGQQPNTTANATSVANATSNANETALPWNDTLSYIPFTPHLDAAFGVGGALMILTGIPVATLGGRHRWSCLAIVSGYSVGLFTLVIILSFGVSPALAPPSPHPPTAAMRGLYLLAVAISFIVGSAIGIFFFTFAKYWVGAAGGFALGWFLVCLRKGGLVTSVGGRWGIIGGLTAVVLACGLVPKLHEYIILGASAWVGATIFTLGVDCFTRAGLKEFYVYNLGYEALFPSLNGGKYPLTQAMQVELGVIAAAALIAGAIQFKIVSVLRKRRNHIREQEEARDEARRIAIAAENFKNVDAELADWEGHHGEGKALLYNDTPTTPSTIVGYASGPGKRESSNPSVHVWELSRLSGQPDPRQRALEEKNYATDKPVSGDPELEQKVQLLADVRRARESIRSSMDALRSGANTPTLDRAASRPATVVSMGGNRSASPATSAPLRSGSREEGSVMDRRRFSASSAGLLGDEQRSRRVSASGEQLLGPRSATSGSALGVESGRRDSLGSQLLQEGDGVASAGGRPLSAVELSRPTSVVAEPAETRSLSQHTGSATGARPVSQKARLDILGSPSTIRHVAATSGSVPAPAPTPSSPPKPELTEWERKAAEHEAYVQSRTIISPDRPRPSVDFTRPSSDYAVVSGAVARRVSSSATPGSPEKSPGQEYGTHLARVMSLEREHASVPTLAPAPRSRRTSTADRPPRTMTTEELAQRHHQALARMQDRVSGPIKEELAVAAAKEEWEERNRAEREAQRRRDAERAQETEGGGDAGVDKALPTPPTAAVLTDRSAPRSSERAERAKRTEEWRQSLPVSPVSPVSPKLPKVKPGQVSSHAMQRAPVAHPHPQVLPQVFPQQVAHAQGQGQAAASPRRKRRSQNIS